MGAHGRSLATSGDQWRPSSVRTHTSVHASSRPCAPMSAHERPLVPEGARRCQGVLASMGAHGRSLATSGDQWRPSSVRTHTSVHASSRPCAPMSAHERPLVPEGARRCQGVLASMGAHGRSLATSGDQWRPSSVRTHTSVHASSRPCVPMSAHERPSVPEGARRCQGVLASMGAHGRSLATSGDQWRRSSVRAHTSVHASGRPCAPMSAHERP